MSEQTHRPGQVTVGDTIDLQDEDRIVQHLRHSVLEEITGANGKRVLTDFPRDRFFAGALAPEQASGFEDADDELQSKMNPSAIGGTVQIGAADSEDMLEIEVSGTVWVRVHPTYEELQNDDDFVSLGETNRGESDDDLELLEVFERFELEIPTIEVPMAALIDGCTETPDTVTDQATTAFQTAIDNVKTRVRNRGDISVYRITDEEIPEAALEDSESYEEYLETRSGKEAFPSWNASLDVTASAGENNTLRVDFGCANRAETSREDSRYTRRDPTLFEVVIDLQYRGSGSFVPFTFDPLPEDFRYNRDLWGHGRNCTISAPKKKREDRTPTPGRSAPPDDPATDHLQTQYIPEFKQLAYESADRGPDPRFDTLADLQKGGLDLLKDVAGAMDSYLKNRYGAAREEYRSRDDWNTGRSGRGGNDEQDFETDRAKFEREINRFRRGIECLDSHPDTVGTAFERMNETMDEMHSFDSWWLFQLVFIVMLIPDVASREYEEFSMADWQPDGKSSPDNQPALDIVDVLWFPTGGGKTEAFLGVAVWSAFFDRLRGKKFGVTAWTRYPLRLLSMQQMQRMAETMMYADMIRRNTDNIDEHPARPFSVGFMVGKKNTPNSLTGYNNSKATELRQDDQRREDLKVLPKCPVCDAPTEMRVTDNHRLAHVCTNTTFDCEWQQRDLDPVTPYTEDELPVHIVDNELYRYAPTVLAGTIDKVTAIGYQRKMAHLLTGQMDLECPIHGFASIGECTEKYGCEIDGKDFEAMASPVTPYDPAPSLEVPDELHLLEESVGSFDGHYETTVQELQEMSDAGKTKIIAPTATITDYDEQVYHLFLRDAERFPALGPFLRENFYAEEKPRIQRYYVGITPHGKTHINAIIDILYHYHRAVQDLIEDAVHEPEAVLSGDALDPDGIRDPLDIDSIGELFVLLSNYTTSLTYLLSRKDGDRLDQSIRSQLETYFLKDDRPALNPERMTGGTPFERIQDILDILEDPWNEANDREILGDLVRQGLIPDDEKSTVRELRDALERCIADEGDPDRYRELADQASDVALTGLAWLLCYRLNTITATSMISHGVDVERFNMMMFFGMPRQTAEYIQSSSRAGRDHAGIIFNVFHPIRERDQSHYHFFEKYHEFLDRLVEPVAINRWAKNSVYRTQPGLFMSLLLNHYMYEEEVDRLFFGNNARDLIQQKDGTELKSVIENMYGGSEIPTEFLETAHTLTENAASDIQINDEEKWTSERLQSKVMTSLRDVDEQLSIRPTYAAKDLFRSFEGGD